MSEQGITAMFSKFRQLESWKWFFILFFLVGNFCIPLYVHEQLRSHSVQNMVHDIYLVLFTFLSCPHHAGFRLWENAVAELELLSGQKFTLTGNEERPALVLLNYTKEHQIVPRSSLSASPCMYTTFLLPTASEGTGGTDCSIKVQIKSQVTFSSYKLGRKLVRP